MKALNHILNNPSSIDVVKTAKDYTKSPTTLSLSKNLTIEILEQLVANCEALASLCMGKMTLVELDYEVYTVDSSLAWCSGCAGVVFFPGNHVSGDDIIVYQQHRNKHDDTDYIESEGVSVFALIQYLKSSTTLRAV